MTDTDLRSRLLALCQQWRDPEFWKDRGCRMDSQDCAEELEALIALPVEPAPSASREFKMVVTERANVAPTSNQSAGTTNTSGRASFTIQIPASSDQAPGGSPPPETEP